MLNMSSAGYVGAKSPDWLDALVWAFSELILAPQYPFSVQTLRRRSYCGSRFLPNSCSIKPRVEVIRRRFDAGIALDELKDVEEVGAHIVQLGLSALVRSNAVEVALDEAERLFESIAE